MTTVRAMAGKEVAEARTVASQAFATMRPVLPGPALGNPVANQWPTDATVATTPDGAFIVEEGGDIIGVGLVRVLGRVAIIGPVAVQPHHQRRRYDEALVRACVAYARAQGCMTLGLDTFPNSTDHFALYSRLGFLPTGLVVSMCGPVHDHDVTGAMTTRTLLGAHVRRWSQLDAAAREHAAQAIAVICASYLPGYDPSIENRVAQDRALGETVLVYQDQRILGFALCVGGPHAAAPREGAWIRTLAVEPGDQAVACAERLVQACESLAREWGETRLGLPLEPRSAHLFDWLDADGYRPEEILGRMIHGTHPLPTAGVCWSDWR